MRALPRVLRKVQRLEPRVAGAPALAAVVAEPHARGRDADREAVGVPRPGADRVERQAAGARLPLGPGRHVPERPVQLPRLAVVLAAPERGRSGAGLEDARLLGRLDDPDAGDRRVRDVLRETRGRSPAATRRRGRRRSTSGGRRSPDVTLAKYRPLRGSLSANSTTSPAKARCATSKASPGSPRSTNRPFFEPTRSSVIAHLRRSQTARAARPPARPGSLP